MDTGYLSQQVTSIINQLHSYFDEIGLPNHERDSRESELFSALSETLHNQLKLVATEKHDLTEEAHRLIKSIRQMEVALDDTEYRLEDDIGSGELQVTIPLLPCIQTLEEKHHAVARLHRERYEQVKKLAEALRSYASHLEPSFVSVKLPPTSPNAKLAPNFDLSSTYVAALDDEFSRVYDEYNKRIVTVQQLAQDIILLWGELGTPQAQVDSQIVECAKEAPEQLGLHEDDLNRLRARKEKLLQEKRDRERRLKDLRQTVAALWQKLGVEEAESKAFLMKARGCGMRAINDFEDELARLNELKRQNLHLFVEDARFKLQELWDALYFSEEEMLDFTPAFSDVYSDALLSAHEAEIARLEALKEQRAPTLLMIEKHRSLIKDRNDLAASSQDASRLMARGQKGEKRDPTRLLREEKMRKRIAKDLPKVEADLRATLERWEDEYGRPFLVHGERYLDELPDSSMTGMTQPRSKTPNLPPSTTQSKVARTVPPPSRNGTIRGTAPPRSHTPTSVRNPGSASIRPPSAASINFSASIAAHDRAAPPSGRGSPSKIPAMPPRAPLSSMPLGNNSPERRPRPAIVGHGREDFKASTRGLMGPPRGPAPKMKDAYMPPTPTPINYADMGERSASIVRHVDPEDVYGDNESLRSMPEYRQHSRAPSELSNYPTPMSIPVSRFDYPPAPPPAMSRQISNTSSVMTSNSAVSGSENWETYTDASEDCEPEPDARAAYFAKIRTVQRGSPEGGYDHAMQKSGVGKMARDRRNGEVQV
ncbi:hypothetical protein AAFC00_003234 [Neodothiora populina]|uniref:Microtubule associated protein n=1 Tax=Neodothiora populina TaxID=2781224 RepID=A0ABR3P9R1_9PEZI